MDFFFLKGWSNISLPFIFVMNHWGFQVVVSWYKKADIIYFLAKLYLLWVPSLSCPTEASLWVMFTQSDKCEWDTIGGNQHTLKTFQEWLLSLRCCCQGHSERPISRFVRPSTNCSGNWGFLTLDAVQRCSPGEQGVWHVPESISCPCPAGFLAVFSVSPRDLSRTCCCKRGHWF